MVGFIFACSLAALSPAALAQTTLVSSTGQSPLGTDGITFVGFAIPSPQVARAQQFTTGSNPDGYTLSSVSFIVNDWEIGDSVAVAIYSDSNGLPDTELYALDQPDNHQRRPQHFHSAGGFCTGRTNQLLRPYKCTCRGIRWKWDALERRGSRKRDGLEYREHQSNYRQQWSKLERWCGYSSNENQRNGQGPQHRSPPP